MTSRQLRLLRAAAASAIATLLAAVSHTIAGGPAPAPLLVVAMAVLLVPVVALLIGTRLSRRRAALTVALSQVAFHLVFQVLGAPTGMPVGGHDHHLLPLGPVMVAALPDAAMLLSHVVAAAATTAALWHGESLLRAMAGWMRAVLLPAIAVAPPRHERPAALVSVVASPIDRAQARAVSRRGPPALV